MYGSACRRSRERPVGSRLGPSAEIEMQMVHFSPSAGEAAWQGGLAAADGIRSAERRHPKGWDRPMTTQGVFVSPTGGDRRAAIRGLPNFR